MEIRSIREPMGLLLRSSSARVASALVAACAVVALLGGLSALAGSPPSGAATNGGNETVPGGPTGTYVVPARIHKIRHVIVIMQENRSFDTYFGTYPGADGIPRRP